MTRNSSSPQSQKSPQISFEMKRQRISTQERNHDSSRRRLRHRKYLLSKNFQEDSQVLVRLRTHQKLPETMRLGEYWVESKEKWQLSNLFELCLEPICKQNRQHDLVTPIWDKFAAFRSKSHCRRTDWTAGEPDNLRNTVLWSGETTGKVNCSGLRDYP